MANEFKIKKGLIVTGASGGTVVDIQGSQGQLFSVTDNLSGSIFAVSDISGVPIFDVNSSGLSTFDGNVNLPDNNKLLLGTGNDLEIYHNGSDSYIKDAGAGDLRIVASKTRIYDADLSHLQAQFTDGGSVDLYYSGNKKFETTSTGVTVTGSLVVSNDITATGDLDIRDIDARNLTLSGKGTSAATITSDGSSTLTTKGYVNSLITGATIYRGTWDPDVSLNSGYGNPNLNTVTQTSGYYYICSADGAATPNGATTEPNTWNTGDWVIWNDDIGASGEWQKIDNSSVLSGIGTGQTVALWEGLSTVTDSETLGNAPITVSGNNTTFAGNVALTGDLRVTADASTADIVAQWADSNGNNTATFRTTTPGQIFEIRSQNNGTLKFDSTSSTFTGNVGVAGKTPTYGLTLAQGTAVGSKIAWTDSTPNFAASIYANSSTDKLTFATKNSSNVETTALEIDISQNATFAGTISSGAITSTANISGVNLIASTAVYSGGIFYGSSTLSLKKSNGNSYVDFDTNLNATFAGDVNVTGGKVDITQSSATDPVLRLTDDGIANYDFIFPDTSTIKLETSTSSTKTFKLLNAGSGDFNFEASSATFAGLVSGITPVNAANFVTKAYVDGSGGGTGPFLPLAGGTMTGVTQFNDHTQHGDQVSAKWGAGNDLTIKHNATDSFIENYTGHLSIVNYANDKDITLWNDDGTGGIAKYLVLDGNTTHAYFTNPGNVGIGTTSPGSYDTALVGSGHKFLNVQASSTNYAVQTLAGDSGTNGNRLGYLTFVNDNNNATYKYSAWIGSEVEGTTANKQGGRLILSTTSDNSTAGPIERMRITSGGNVGIGTTSPNAKLTVSNGGAAGLEFFPEYTTNNNLINNYNRSSAAYVTIETRASEHYWDIGTTNKMSLSSSGNLNVNGEIQGDSFSGPGEGLDNLLSLGAYDGSPSVGILIATNIVTNNYGFIFGTIKIEQFNFTSKQTIEFSATVNSNGTLITKDATSDVAITFKLFNYSGKWYLWFPMPSTYSTCTAFVNTGAGYQGQSKGFNEVASVSVGAVPGSGVTNSYDITPKVYLTTATPGGNLPGGPYLPLSAGSSYPLTGDLYTGTFAINTRRLNISSFTAGAGLVMNYGNASGTVEFISLQSNGVTSPIKLQMRQSPNESDLILAGSSGNGLTLTSASNALFAGKVAVNGTSIFADAELDVLGDITLINRNWALRGNNSNADFVIEKVAGNNFNDNNIAVTVSQFKNVGIGTTSPQQLLHINNTSGDFAAEAVLRGSTSTGTPKSEIAFKRFTSGDGAEMVLRTSNSSGTIQDVMTLDTAGNVGIGTTTPQEKLHIEGTGAASEMQILVSGASDTVGHTAGIGLRAEGGESNSNVRVKGGIFFERIAGSFGNGKMILAVNSSVDNNSATVADHALTIDNNKNVGIGTSSPEDKLEVSGGSLKIKTVASATLAPSIKLGRSDQANGNYENHISSQTGSGASQCKIEFKVCDTSATGRTTLLSLDGGNNRSIFQGNVGIGTTLPKTSLDIVKDSDIWHLMVGGATKKLLVGGQAASGDVVLQAGAASTVNNAAVTTPYNLCLQRDGGNVGIGTASPNFKLDVGGTLGVSDLPFNASSTSVLVANETLSAELVTNGDFDTNTNWANQSGTNWSISGGKASVSNSASVRYFQQSGVLPNPSVNKSFLIKWTISGLTQGGIGINVGGYITTTIQTSNGTYEQEVTPTNASSNTILYLQSNANTIGSVDNVSVKEITSASTQIQKRSLGSGAFSDELWAVTPTDSNNIYNLNSGNVGIGTSTPLAKLDIQGTQGQLFSVTDDLSGSIFAVSDISGVPIFDVNSSGVSYFDGNVGINVTNPGFQSVDSLGQIGIEIKGSKESNTAPCLRLHETGSSKGSFELRSNRNAATSGNYFAIAEGTDTFFTIRGDDDNGGLTTRGNVGIGTTSPAAKLVVSDGTQAFSVNPHSTGIDLHSTGNLAPHYQTDFTLYTGAIGSGSAKVTVNSAGNVGIGTTSPLKNLHIEAAGTADSIIRLSAAGNSSYYSDIINSVNSTRGFAIQTNGADALTIAGSGGYTGITIGNNNTNLLIKPSSGDFVFTGGNVGINNTSPGEKLDVTGNIFVSGKFGNLVANTSGVQFEAATTATQTCRFDSDEMRFFAGGGAGEVFTMLNSTGATTFTNTVTATNFILSSDERLKENIKTLEPKVIYADWKSFNAKNDDSYRTGVIAQELEKKHPEFVETNDKGFKSVKYIDLLISKIAELEARLEKAGI